MKNKQDYFIRSSFAFLFFVMLGYTVRFYPMSLVTFDDTIQNAVRGNLPNSFTLFFKHVTVLGNVLSQVILVASLSLIFYLKKWKAEALFLLTNGLMSGLVVMLFKLIYQRLRPSLEHIVYAGGFSFPSGHALGSMMIYGALLIIFLGRVTNKKWRYLLVSFMIGLILLIGISRIYLGVHYPTDVIGGFVCGFGFLNLFFPYYQEKRFKWRFQSKQE